MGFEDCPSLFGVGAVDADHNRRVDLHPLERLHDAIGHFVAARDAAKDVDQDRTYVGVGIDDLERIRHDRSVRAATDIQEIGGCATRLIDDVEGAHGQPGTIGDDADAARQPDVLQPFAARQVLALVQHLGCPVFLPLRVAELSVVVEADLRIQGMHPPVGREHQRVDLDQIGVTLDEAAVELAQDVDGTVTGLFIQAGLVDQSAGIFDGQPLHWIDMQPRNRVRVFGRDLLDVDATLRRHHAQMLARATVERERGVVLMGDVRGALDPQALDRVAADVHAQNGPSVGPDLVRTIRQFYAPSLTPPADEHLGFDDDRVADSLSLSDRVVNRFGHTPRRHRYAKTGKVLLALVLEEIHT